MSHQQNQQREHSTTLFKSVLNQAPIPQTAKKRTSKLPLQLLLETPFSGMLHQTMVSLTIMLLKEKLTLAMEPRPVDGPIHLDGLITVLVMSNSFKERLPISINNSNPFFNMMNPKDQQRLTTVKTMTLFSEEFMDLTHSAGMMTVLMTIPFSHKLNQNMMNQKDQPKLTMVRMMTSSSEEFMAKTH